MKFAVELSKALVPAPRLASILDWKRLGGACIMALDISNDRIGVAFGNHPSRRTPICTLPPIAFAHGACGSKKRNRVESDDENVVATLKELMKRLDVCGFVVGWPLQSDGRPGKPCGRVLHVLDKLAYNKDPVLSQRRPFVLWDDRYSSRAGSGVSLISKHDMPTDSFGRCVAYSQVPSFPPGRSCSSEEWYNRPTAKDSSVASDILKTYLETNCKCSSDYDFNFLEEDCSSRPTTAFSTNLLYCA